MVYQRSSSRTVIVAVALLAALLLYLIWPLLLPFLLAAALAQLFQTPFRWLVCRLRSYRRVAAGLMTAAVVLILVVPLFLTVLMTGRELAQISNDVATQDWVEHESVQDLFGWLERYGLIESDDSESVRESLREVLSASAREIYNRTWQVLSGIGAFLVGSAIFVVSLYFCFADGPRMLARMDQFSLLDHQVDRALFREFDRVCRGVIQGTLVAAATQAVLMGLALWVAGIDLVWLLMSLTFVSAMLPVVGSAAVWGPTAVWLALDQNYGAAVGVLLWGSCVVSTSDNLVRAYVIGGQARLHPLVALIAVLGAVRIVGLWGFLVGPVLAAFLHALLRILRHRSRDRERRIRIETPRPPLRRDDSSRVSSPSNPRPESAKRTVAE